MTAACCQTKGVVCGFVHSADSGEAGCRSYGCFRTIHAHTHTHAHSAVVAVAAREFSV